jgi:uncharacterized protein (DUF39 family)
VGSYGIVINELWSIYHRWEERAARDVDIAGYRTSGTMFSTSRKVAFPQTKLPVLIDIKLNST